MNLQAESSPFRWKRILVPTDFSEPSTEAVNLAIYLAGKCGATINLLNVIQLPIPLPLEAGMAMDDLLNSSQGMLGRIPRGASPALFRESLVRLATQGIVREIVQTARELKADLIVIATHGEGGLKHMLLGGTTEKVICHAPCPVLIVVPSCPGTNRRHTNN